MSLVKVALLEASKRVVCSMLRLLSNEHMQHLIAGPREESKHVALETWGSKHVVFEGCASSGMNSLLRLLRNEHL